MSGFIIPWLNGVDLSANYFDKDHHGLLEKLDALIGAISSGDRARVLSAADALSEVAMEHFSNEEQRMRQSGYPAMARHCASHRELIQSLADFHQKVSLTEDLPSVLGDTSFLEQWLVPHLTNDDKRLAEFLSAREFGGNVLPP